MYVKTKKCAEPNCQTLICNESTYCGNHHKLAYLSKKLHVVCAGCTKDFYAYPSQSTGKHLYCSKECFRRTQIITTAKNKELRKLQKSQNVRKPRIEKVSLVCPICDKSYIRYPSLVSKTCGVTCAGKLKTLTALSNPKPVKVQIPKIKTKRCALSGCDNLICDISTYCVTHCRGKSKVHLVCPICTKSFTRSSSELWSINYCSCKCKQKANETLMLGRTHTEESKRKMSLSLGGNGIAIVKPTYNTLVFNDRLKNKIRARDNFECQLCFKTQEQNIFEKCGKLNIHHISYDKLNNSEDNLISLCNDCHGTTHSGARRESWAHYFQTLIAAKKSKFNLLGVK